MKTTTQKIARKRRPSTSGKYAIEDVSLLNFSTQCFFDVGETKQLYFKAYR